MIEIEIAEAIAIIVLYVIIWRQENQLKQKVKGWE